MMKKITIRILLTVFLLVTSQFSGENNVSDGSPVIKDTNLLKNDKKVVKEDEIPTLKTNSKENNFNIESEENKQLTDLRNWLKTFPKIEANSEAVDFINTISPMAVIIAEKEGVYPSVMIAQAGLESAWGKSALAVKHNNLMGTKGSYQGNRVTMPTSEEVAGESIQIQAGFSVYNSWTDSLSHYGKILRDGLEWDSDFYKGTWQENTESYEDATSWLVGRYASDRSYSKKLNTTIEKYDLARFDDLEVLDFDKEHTLKELTNEI